MPEIPENIEQNEAVESVNFTLIDFNLLLSYLIALNGEISQISSQEIKNQFTELFKPILEEIKKLQNQLYKNYQNHITLLEVLRNFRARILQMQEELDALMAPPLLYGYVARLWPALKMADVFINNERRKVNIFPKVNIDKLKIGQRVELAGSNLAILNFDEEWEKTGQEATVSNLINEDIVRVVTSFDQSQDVILAEPLRNEKIREGDILLVSGRFAFKKLPKAEANELLLEKVPEINFSKIGGLKKQIDALLEAIEYPMIYPELFALHELKPTKGILLYGPPGCGKTLMAKAVANRLAQRLREKINDENISAYFINVKGPELLNKWVGETERKIREVFQRAKEKASEGSPVIIFFDEFESLFRTRGSGISSDMESTIVPQFLSMMDGVEEISNVVVIGATNRQDLIDPAVLRPGRFDLKIKVDRPDKLGAKEIFKIYVTSNLPWGNDSDGKPYIGQKEHSAIDRLHSNKPYAVNLSTPELMVEHVINVVVDYLYYDGSPIDWTDRRGNRHEYNTECVETTAADGEKKKLYIKDILVSGAMIESIVSRVKRIAIKRTIATSEPGIKIIDFYTAIGDEVRENSDLPSTNNPDDWAKIIGQYSESGSRIVNVRFIGAQKAVKARDIEKVVSTGQYI